MPIAIDANVLARALVDDGSDQASRSRAMLTEQDIFVPDSVLLETEWLLRAVMKLDRSHINNTFGTLLGSANIAFSNRGEIADIVASHGAGLDFADAMHLRASSECDAFASFDASLKRRAKKIAGCVPVVTP